MVSLSGKVALVTGSSRGIGRAIALAFATAGADVAVHYRAAGAEAEEVAAAVRRLGRRVVAVQGDVRCDEEVAAIFAKILRELGPLDILVNNAGYALVKPFLSITPDEWTDQIETLAGGYYRCIRAALPGMVARGRGTVLNIASTCGVRGSAGEAAYAAANGAVVALTRSLAAEFGPAGVRINALLVTWAENAFDPADPDHAAFLPSFALRRVVTVDEIAKAAVFLCSEAAAGVTGAALPVDAGFLCG